MLQRERERERERELCVDALRAVWNGRGEGEAREIAGGMGPQDIYTHLGRGLISIMRTVQPLPHRTDEDLSLSASFPVYLSTYLSSTAQPPQKQQQTDDFLN